MSSREDLDRVLDGGIVAIIRAPSGEQLVDVARALHAGGIDVIEVTFTVPGVLDIIRETREALGDQVLLGAGTVLDPESARAALLAGAEFIVSPVVNTDVIAMCRRYDRICMPGAFTPTEVLTAWEAGAEVVKVFPADVGGPNYLKALHGPLPQVRLMPTGGVDLQTLPDFVGAGACAVGLGSALVEKEAVASGNMDRIRQLATEYVRLMRQTREQLGQSQSSGGDHIPVSATVASPPRCRVPSLSRPYHCCALCPHCPCSAGTRPGRWRSNVPVFRPAGPPRFLLPHRATCSAQPAVLLFPVQVFQGVLSILATGVELSETGSCARAGTISFSLNGVQVSQRVPPQPGWSGNVFQLAGGLYPASAVSA